MILETERLILRKMDGRDFKDLREILQDPEVMYAYEHAFSDEEAADWLARQLLRYTADGIGLYAAVLKETGEMIGQAGLTIQEIGERQVVEIGYLFKKKDWHKGYATEAAIALRGYAFDTLGVEEVYSIIRDNNLASQRVAERNGMRVVGQIVKHYYRMDMPHFVYRITREEAAGLVGGASEN